MKLLLDEMMDPRIADQLRQRGHDVIAVGEVGVLQGLSDRAILSAARADDRVVVTEDLRDYRRIAAAEGRAGRPHPGLVLTNNRRWPRANRRTLGRLVNALDALLTSGAAVEGEYWLAPPD